MGSTASGCEASYAHRRSTLVLATFFITFTLPTWGPRNNQFSSVPHSAPFYESNKIIPSENQGAELKNEGLSQTGS
jgi:hypothetical protein